MILASEVIGAAHEPRFASRRTEHLSVRWSEASRRRLRRETDAGTDVAVDLPRGTYLADGLVVADDGQRIIVVARRPEPALRVRFDRSLGHEALIRCAALVAHAFGGQHVPMEIERGELRFPITTSEQVARDTVARVGLEGASVSVDEIPLGRQRPLLQGHSNGR